MSVIAECRERFGDTPCIRVIARDGTIREVYDCVGYCPLLRRKFEDEDAKPGGVYVRDS